MRNYEFGEPAPFGEEKKVKTEVAPEVPLAAKWLAWIVVVLLLAFIVAVIGRGIYWVITGN